MKSNLLYNMKMIKVSIIIPIYNVEKYLEKCLDSCLNQTLEEIEVIAVCDASPDHSSVIMKKYERKYPGKIINVFLNENLKQGGARNKGIEIAKGKYICFVDGDDYIDYTMCEKLYIKGEKEKLDIVCCNGFYVYTNKKLYWEKIKSYDSLSKTHLQNFTGQCYMIIRRDIIVRNNLFYPAHILHEDCSVVPLWYLKADKVGLVDEGLYYQNIHNDSSGSRIGIDSTLQILKSMDILLDNAKKLGLYLVHKDKIDCLLISRIGIAANRVLKLKNIMTSKDISEFVQELKMWKDYLFDETLIFRFMSREEYEQSQLFIQNFEDFIEQDERYVKTIIISSGYHDMNEKIEHIIRAADKRNAKIVVWGVGNRGIVFIHTLKSLGVDYVIGDNNEKLLNKRIETGDIVRNLEWIVKNVDNPIFLITPTRFYTGIVNGLRKKIATVIAIDVFSYFVYENYDIDACLECYKDD